MKLRGSKIGSKIIDTYIVSFFKADLMLFSVLNDSNVRVYSPGATPVVSMSTSLESDYSSSVTKLSNDD